MAGRYLRKVLGINDWLDGIYQLPGSPTYFPLSAVEQPQEKVGGPSRVPKCRETRSPHPQEGVRDDRLGQSGVCLKLNGGALTHTTIPL